ncbi:MAG: DUF2846 domain-containing protein [Methyloprofundus sp.]|nr:DUF2846 domain-containing protein [Methyloprofundus sp.]
MKKIFLISVTMLVMFLLIGCAPAALTGANFKQEIISDANNAHIYIYWTERAANNRVDFEIIINGEQVTDLKRGGYYLYRANPGNVDIVSSPNFTYGQMGVLDMALTANGRCSLKVEADKQYFIRSVITGTPGSYKLQMNQVDHERGVYELRTAKLLPKVASKEAPFIFAQK